MNKTISTVTSLVSVLMCVGASMPPSPSGFTTTTTTKKRAAKSAYPTQGSGALSLLSTATKTATPQLVLRKPRTVTIKCTWDPSIGSNIVKYLLYSGPAPRTYTNILDVGTNLTGSVTNIITKKVWMAATAVDKQGLESDYSAESYWWPPIPLTNLVVVVTGTNLAWTTNDCMTGPWTALATNITINNETNPTCARKFWQGINVQISTYRYN